MAPSLTITVLVENSVARHDVMAEHGLSFWIDTGKRRILSDTGQSNLIIANAKKLNVDLNSVDTVVISHGHYDHTGGLSDVLTEAADKVKIYLHPSAMLPRYHKSNKVIREISMPVQSVNILQTGKAGVETITAPTEIAPGITITGKIPRIHPEEEDDQGFYLDIGGTKVDRIPDDQSLFMSTQAGTVVILGCAHSGLINTLDYIHKLTSGQPIVAVMGGMHLQTASDNRIAWTVKSLGRFDIRKFYPVHCTGAKAVAAIWAAFPGNCFPCGVGTRLEF